MSTAVYENDHGNSPEVYAALFFGGTKRGRCIQIAVGGSGVQIPLVEFYAILAGIRREDPEVADEIIKSAGGIAPEQAGGN